MNKTHSIRNLNCLSYPHKARTHCGLEGAMERSATNEFSTISGYRFEAIEVKGPDKRITCGNCQRRRDLIAPPSEDKV